MLLSVNNIRKTINYCKKNGFKEGYYAISERISQRKNKYDYDEVEAEVLEKQAEKTFPLMPKISVLVPAYETKEIFIEDLILSLEDQSYSNYELIIADASETDKVKNKVEDLNSQYGNIHYYRLDENKGISENSNKALQYVTGEYVALLDHDDVLTPDALYEVVNMINKNKDAVLIYSDEDKGSEYLDTFYEPNIKSTFNKDMLLSNNYICHLSVYKSEVLKSLGFRPEYDGAQDFDLILRTLLYVEKEFGEDKVKDYIVHIPKVLYHWRCHESSTAANPESKNYAYDAGLRAVQSYLKEKEVAAKVCHSKHLGFYYVDYEDDIFSKRKDIGVVGGPVIENHKVSGGAMDAKGKILFEGLNEHFAGYLNRAVIQQQVQAVDVRNMKIRGDLKSLFEKTFGFEYKDIDKNISENTSKDKNQELMKKSLIFCNKVRNKGISILYDPNLKEQ